MWRGRAGGRSGGHPLICGTGALCRRGPSGVDRIVVRVRMGMREGVRVGLGMRQWQRQWGGLSLLLLLLLWLLLLMLMLLMLLLLLLLQLSVAGLLRVMVWLKGEVAAVGWPRSVGSLVLSGQVVQRVNTMVVVRV